MAVEKKSIMESLGYEKEVRELIECPICLEIPLPPIYLCIKGHIVCNLCQARTKFCPLCREKYSSTRSFVAEGIVEQCVMRCKNTEQGCIITLKGSEMSDHLKICSFRQIRCIDCGGKWVNYGDYFSHLLQVHKINGIDQSKGYVIYNMNLNNPIQMGEKYCWPQYYFRAFGKLFLLRLHATHWFICAWFSLIGPLSDCENYTVKLELHPPSDDIFFPRKCITSDRHLAMVQPKYNLNSSSLVYGVISCDLNEYEIYL